MRNWLIAGLMPLFLACTPDVPPAPDAALEPDPKSTETELPAPPSLEGLADGAILVKRADVPLDATLVWKAKPNSKTPTTGHAVCIEAMPTKNCDGAKSLLYDGLSADESRFPVPEGDLLSLRAPYLSWYAMACAETGCVMSERRSFHLTADSNGLYVLAFSEASGAVLVAYSISDTSDFGWSDPIRLTDSFDDNGTTRDWRKQTDRAPAVASDNFGTYLAVWRIGLHHSSGFLLATNKGEVTGSSVRWQGPSIIPTVRLVMHDYKCLSGPAAAFGAGRWTLVCRGDLIGSTNRLIVIQSPGSNPDMWQAPTVVNLPSGVSVHSGTTPALTFGDDGYVLVFEQDDNSVVSVSSSDGVSWSSPVTLPDTNFIVDRDGPRVLAATAYRGRYFVGVGNPGTDAADVSHMFNSDDATNWDHMSKSLSAVPSPYAVGIAIGALPIYDPSDPNEELECELVSVMAAPGLGGVRWTSQRAEEQNCVNITEFDYGFQLGAGFASGDIAPGSTNAARAPAVAYGANP